MKKVKDIKNGVLKNENLSLHIEIHSVPTYYHTLDEKYMYGIAKQLSTNTPYVEVEVHPEDTFDSIANKYYGRPDYYYIIRDTFYSSWELQD